MPRILDGTSPDALTATARAAAEALRAGEVVVLPTDTVYGLMALPANRAALDRVVALKRREVRQPMAVLVGSVDQALALADASDPRLERLFRWGWPGALTIVAHRRTGWDVDLGGDASTLGLRWPRSQLLGLVTVAVGPVVATSANRHGDPTPTTVEGVLDAFDDEIDLLVDGGALTDVPSTVVDVTMDEPVVLRFGPVSTGDIMACWRGEER